PSVVRRVYSIFTAAAGCFRCGSQPKALALSESRRIARRFGTLKPTCVSIAFRPIAHASSLFAWKMGLEQSPAMHGTPSSSIRLGKADLQACWNACFEESERLDPVRLRVPSE